MDTRNAVQTLITLIKSQVATPHVLDYLPLQPDMTVLKDNVTYNERLHFYTVRRMFTELGHMGANFNAFDSPLHIEGRLAYLDSSTQEIIDNELDAILTRIAQQPTLSGTVQGIQNLRLAENRPYAFYNQTVHYARIELEVRII